MLRERKTKKLGAGHRNCLMSLSWAAMLPTPYFLFAQPYIRPRALSHEPMLKQLCFVQRADGGVFEGKNQLQRKPRVTTADESAVFGDKYTHHECFRRPTFDVPFYESNGTKGNTYSTHADFISRIRLLCALSVHRF